MFKLEDLIIKVKSVHPEAKLPDIAKLHDGGADLFSIESHTIGTQTQGVIDTGIQVEAPKPPEGWKWLFYVTPRSGYAAKNRISITNSPGLIDESYRGTIKVILSNESPVNDFIIEKGQKIAQLTAFLVPDVKFAWAETLTETDRGEGGFGHTGK